jgi:hypothetical protein
MKACKPLAEYSWFINEIRKNQNKGHSLEVAVNTALDEMPEYYVIRSFLMIHKQEVHGMLDTEYNEAEVMELFKEDGKKEEAYNINTLYTWLFDLGRVGDVRKAAGDEAFMKALFE